jgi:hypothetical protein
MRPETATPKISIFGVKIMKSKKNEKREKKETSLAKTTKKNGPGPFVPF